MKYKLNINVTPRCYCGSYSTSTVASIVLYSSGYSTKYIYSSLYGIYTVVATVRT
jgi:hypothetical protein